MDETRMARNRKFTCGVDDAPSDCDLDDVKQWHFMIVNNDDGLLSRSDNLETINL